MRERRNRVLHISGIILCVLMLICFSACTGGKDTDEGTADAGSTQSVIAESSTKSAASETVSEEPAGTDTEEPAENDAAEPAGTDTEEPAGNSTEEYVETYPRTKIVFTYNSLYEGTLNPKGTARLLVVPVEIEGGDLFDEAALARIQQRIEGPYNNPYCLDVRRYYNNASYGQFDIECDIMPVYSLGITLDEWTGDEHKSMFKYLYAQEAIEYSISHYVSDPGVYDSDGDGFLDGVICVYNEPSEVESVSGCPRYGDDDVERCAENAKIRMFVDTMLHCFNDATIYMSNTVSHELAHCFGIEDYYDYSRINAFSTYFDLQGATYGDWNSFSKMAVGWIDPYVITPDVDKVTVRLRNSAEYPDAILIPIGEWNGTPFDEYLLVDVMADRGNNSLPFSWYYQTDPEKGGSEDYGGVRLYHVDARLMKRTHYTGEGLGWFDDFSGPERCSKFDVCSAYTNSTSEADRMNDSPDRNPDYHMLSLIPASGKPLGVSEKFYSSYLFHTGDVFTADRYSAFFPNYPLGNKRESINYKFTVDSFDNKTKEAVITIEKVN
ncbi:MAG: hypothetical protein IKG08_03615 [Eubacterium sp.]|nr:hypothetical protein [Eubacterium sp.]